MACSEELHRDGSGALTIDPTGPGPDGHGLAGDELARLLLTVLSEERLSSYLDACDGSATAALALYQWNTAAVGAYWETLAHLEVIVRNVLDRRLTDRHRSRGRPGDWLADPARELTSRSRDDIRTAQTRVQRKGRPVAHGQVISELPFGFWRFLVSRRYTSLWPDLASGFPFAPDRRLSTVERPLADLHELRNRLAHHHRIWPQPLSRRYTQITALAGYVDPELSRWLNNTSRVPAVLAARPGTPTHR